MMEGGAGCANLPTVEGTKALIERIPGFSLTAKH